MKNIYKLDDNIYKPMPIHQLLKKLRHDRGVSQQGIAEKLHISQNSYSLIESGKTKIDEQRLVQLATIFDISPAELLSSDVKSFNNKNENTYAAHIQTLNAENKELTNQLTTQLARKDEQISWLLQQIDHLLKLIKK